MLFVFVHEQILFSLITVFNDVEVLIKIILFTYYIIDSYK